LEKFRKDVFNVSSLVSYAEDLTYLSALKSEFKRVLRDPSDDFTQFAIRSARLVDGRVTQRVVDRFRPLVRDAISAAILEIVGQSFMVHPACESPATGEAEPVFISEAARTLEAPVTGRGAVWTAEELQAFDMLRCMLGEHVPEPAELAYRDSADGFFIQYASSNQWFARFVLEEREQKEVILRLPADRTRELAPDFRVSGVQRTRDRSRVYIQSLADLDQLKSAFIAAVREVVG
jgi:predicted type IV restriction endonuclease